MQWEGSPSESHTFKRKCPGTPCRGGHGGDETDAPNGAANGTRFQAETLNSLRRRLPEYLAARGVELRKHGPRLVGRCPMHDDRNPSFAVFGTHLENCGCHPCGFTGDVFAVSQWLGRATTFPEAVHDVANALGVYLPQSPARTVTGPTTVPQRRAKQPEPPFILSEAERKKIHAARLAFTDVFWSGDAIVDRIAASLGLDRETLRYAAWGNSGLGLFRGWLCYAYPQGLKWRNPDANSKPRFKWIVGKPTVPWRVEWIRPSTRTVYLTEGESDCLALIASGLETDGTAVCVASPGTSFHTEWAPLFRGKRVVLCFDLDDPGRTAATKVATMLQDFASEVLTWKGTRRHE